MSLDDGRLGLVRERRETSPMVWGRTGVIRLNRLQVEIVLPTAGGEAARPGRTMPTGGEDMVR